MRALHLLIVLSFLTLLAIDDVAAADHFLFANNTLRVTTPMMELGISGGAVTYLKDISTGDILVNSDPWSNRPPWGAGFVGFTSRDSKLVDYRRWPTPSSQVTFSQISSSEATLTYSPLYLSSTASNSRLVISARVDETTGEVILQATGAEADPALKPSRVDIPIMNIVQQSVILSNGERFLRIDPPRTDQSSHRGLGLLSPSMAVVEGSHSVLAAWSETIQYPTEYIELIHKQAQDQLSMHNDQSLMQQNKSIIVSSPWRIGTYTDWTKAARRWRETFEARTGAKPLWERTSWVRDIHAVYRVPLYENATKYQRLANLTTPKKVLYFLWNGDRLILFGDHTWMPAIVMPSARDTALIRQYGWPLIVYHPWDLTQTDNGAVARLVRLRSMSWLPANYTFNPDYGGAAANWYNYWAGMGFNDSDYYNNSLYVLHPGSTKFQDYLARNFKDYCAVHQVNGSYLDILGSDMTWWYPDAQKVMDGQDYQNGQRSAIHKVAQENPGLGIMPEYQATELLPYSFFTWGGPVTYLRNPYEVHFVNHPLRAALVSSYSWMREDSFDTTPIPDGDAALLGTLPEITFAGDRYYGSTGVTTTIDTASATWQQSRARLFCDYELYNDIPDQWDADALAYYRSSIGHWFKFRVVANDSQYVEILPNGTQVVRISRSNAAFTCTESDWRSFDGACSSSQTKIRTWTKLTSCSGGTAQPATEAVPCTGTQPLAGDVNHDGNVSLADIRLILADFGKTSGYNMDCDLNHDGAVSLPDLAIVATRYGSTASP